MGIGALSFIVRARHPNARKNAIAAVLDIAATHKDVWAGSLSLGKSGNKASHAIFITGVWNRRSAPSLNPFLPRIVQE